MIQAAEQMFKKDGEYSSLIWLAFVHDDKPRPLIFLIHDHGIWKGFPDQWDGEIVRFPHPGTVQGFAFLIDKVGLQLGTFLWSERSYRTEVETRLFYEKDLQTGEIKEGTLWEFEDSYGRTLRLEWPGMHIHLDYPA